MMMRFLGKADFMTTLCGQCRHFGQGGQCYLNPPIPLPNGLQMRPVVQRDTVACGQGVAQPQPDPQPQQQQLRRRR